MARFPAERPPHSELPKPVPAPGPMIAADIGDRILAACLPSASDPGANRRGEKVEQHGRISRGQRQISERDLWQAAGQGIVEGNEGPTVGLHRAH